MKTFVQRIVPKATWDSLVLPADRISLLQDISHHLENTKFVTKKRGRESRRMRGGVTALFSGASGTGKTMAAEVIANSLDSELYRIDLSTLVSKYIGDTEKNLSRVFIKAEGSGAVLLFDEADALFGKRTEVKDSHDRYSNVEVSYLLQRLEAYAGLSILTTNRRGEIDTAFVRRFSFVVDFPLPRKGKRMNKWHRVKSDLKS